MHILEKCTRFCVCVTDYILYLWYVLLTKILLQLKILNIIISFDFMIIPISAVQSNVTTY